MPAADSMPTVLLGRSCRIELDRPRIMGVLNVTPDSFYDGGRHQGFDAALRQAEVMVAEGVDIIDVGGESTRPGAPKVNAAAESERIGKVIESLTREFAVPVSIDTSKSSVAAVAIAAGAEFVNDISGLRFDPQMVDVASDTGVGLFLMHTRGRPEQMQGDTRYSDLMSEVRSYLEASAALALAAGVSRQKISIDPGIGFAKDLDGNLLLLNRLSELLSLGYPILLGTSRKSFIGGILGLDDPADRLYGTLGSVVSGVERGAQLFRVHDVRAAREAALTAWAIKQAS